MNVRVALLILSLALVPALALAATDAAQASDAAAVDLQSLPCPICGFDMSTYGGPLDAAEVEGLLLALNDEYHAWAVYDQVIADHGDVEPFVNIRRSEQQHIRALTRLFDRYGVPVPDNPWPGNVPSFESVAEACLAGVEAEIANGELYDVLFDTTERSDIERVYSALQRATEKNHLPAFEACEGCDGSGGGGNGPGRGPGRGSRGGGGGGGGGRGPGGGGGGGGR